MELINKGRPVTVSTKLLSRSELNDVEFVLELNGYKMAQHSVKSGNCIWCKV